MAFPIQKADPVADEKEISKLVAESFLHQEPYASIFRDTDPIEYLQAMSVLVAPRLVGKGRETFKIVDPETKYVHLTEPNFESYLGVEVWG